jgi:hypothetical protein
LLGIALPFIRAGYDYTGVDISPASMKRLAGKLAGDPGTAYRSQLRQADIKRCHSWPRVLMLLLWVNLWLLWLRGRAISDWGLGIGNQQSLVPNY